MSAWTTTRVRRAKGKERLPCLTAYDFFSGRLLDQAGIPMILVGDSLGMTVLGYETTLPVTLNDMLHHCKAVARGVKNALLIADMPFLSFQASIPEAIHNAGPFLKEAGADAVKIEGGRERGPTIEALVSNGIPVVGHIGLTPQSVKEMGGYRIQGKTDDTRAALIEDAQALQAAGCFSIVLEGMPATTAAAITAAIDIPTIGIGAGPDCDGQILVFHDLFGMNQDFHPKFVKRYAELGPTMSNALATYMHEVQSGAFPDADHSYR